MLSERQQQILEHLGYEWWMFRATYKLINSLNNIQHPVRHALLESFLIHTRVLTLFFYSPKTKKQDWNIRDLMPKCKIPNPPQVLATFRDFTGGLVAHLGEHRLQKPIEYSIGLVHQSLEKEINKLRTDMGEDFPNQWDGDAPTESTFLSIVNSTPSDSPVATPTITSLHMITGV